MIPADTACRCRLERKGPWVDARVILLGQSLAFRTVDGDDDETGRLLFSDIVKVDRHRRKGDLQRAELRISDGDVIAFDLPEDLLEDLLARLS